MFRQSSLARLSSPEQLDSLLAVTSPRSWAALTALSLLVLTALLWGFFGTITTKVDGEGILLKSGGIRNIVHYHEGRITDIRIQPGVYVKEGDVIARIEEPNLVRALLEQKALVEEKRALYGRLPTENLLHELEALETQMSRKQEEYLLTTAIVSPFEGRILEVLQNRGDILRRGTPLASMELQGPAFREEGFLYVSSYSGQQLAPGMEVRVAPTFVQTEEHGFILGRVIAVSELPATLQSMQSVLGSRELASLFSSQGAPIEVRVELITNPDTFSGYTWTSLSDPKIKITSGTLIRGSIVTGTKRPIELILPLGGRERSL